MSKSKKKKEREKEIDITKDPYCGVAKLKAKQRYGTIEECVQKNQVRYWGLHLINKEDTIKKKIIDRAFLDKEANALLQIRYKIMGLKRKMQKEKNAIKNAEGKTEAIKQKNIEKHENNYAEFRAQTQKAIDYQKQQRQKFRELIDDARALGIDAPYTRDSYIEQFYPGTLNK